MNYKNETFLLEQNIENDFRDFLSKMILTPFKETFSRSIRFSPHSKEEIEKYLSEKDTQKLSKLGTLKLEEYNNKISDILNDQVGSGFFVKKVDYKKYAYFGIPKLHSGASNLLFQRGGVLYFNENNEKNSYYLAVGDSLFEDANYLQNYDDFHTYNSYVYLLHNLLNDSEREILKEKYKNNTKIMRKQLLSGNTIAYSSIPSISRNIIVPSREPQLFEL